MAKKDCSEQGKRVGPGLPAICEVRIPEADALQGQVLAAIIGERIVAAREDVE